MKERRTHPRIDVGPGDDFNARLSTNGKVESGRVIDLNNAGAFIATDLVLERGTRLEVEIDVPELKAMPILALVARRSEQIEGRTKVIPGGLGVVFVTANVEEREFIQQAVLRALRSSARGGAKPKATPTPTSSSSSSNTPASGTPIST